ncbi:MAG: nitroreductase family protein [Anaerolineaceae bacterium]|jgi:nitroreductase
MDTIEAIMSRRSVRQFTNEPVTKEQIDILLHAAMQAPSAGNGQPWHFVVVQERATLDQIPNVHPYAQMLKEAPLAILVCGSEAQTRYANYWTLDCSAATQNLLLAAHAIGLGSVWLGIHPNEERIASIMKLIPLPEKVHPLSLVAVGHPREMPARTNRYKPERVHYEHW